MTVCLYDGSLCGLLTAIFECYERKLQTCSIIKKHEALADAFADTFDIGSDPVKGNPDLRRRRG